MLCALIDYLKYRRNRGIYSPPSIAAKGGKLATSGNFPSPSQYQPMDTFFMHTKGSALSWAVMYFTGPGIWSHTGMFVGDGIVVDATLGGITQHPFSDYLDGISYLAVVQINLSPEQRAAGKALLQSEVGSRYNWAGVWRLLFLHLIGVVQYRVGFALDFAIIFAALLLAFHPWSVLVYAILSIAALYYAVVVLTVSIRRLRGGAVTIAKSPARNAKPH